MFWRPLKLPSVTFATSCWEKDWRQILLHPDYLKVKQIENHAFPFAEKILIINNVSDLAAVKRAALAKIEEGVLSRYVVASEEILLPFDLKRADFRVFGPVPAEWLYYNALAPLAAIHACQSDYLLYLTGDVRLDKKLNWIPKTLAMMEKNSRFKAANPVWNGQYKEAKRESYGATWNFYLAKEGFSDQLFLVRAADFKGPIYKEIRNDADHYPRGDVFEKRVFSYMKNRSFERLIYRRGSYTHENV